MLCWRRNSSTMERLLIPLAIVVAVFLVPSLGLKSNEGKKFILGFLSIDGDRDIRLVITTISNTPADVTVSAPLIDPSNPRRVTVARGERKEVLLPSSWRAGGNSITDKGVLVESTEIVSVYGINEERGSAGGFLAFPEDALGTSYRAATWKYESQLMVVATEDDTEVTIKFPLVGRTIVDITGPDTDVYKNGDIVTKTLNKYQTWNIYGSNDDLSGSMISSTTKRIAVFSGNKKVSVGRDEDQKDSEDSIVEQLIPLNAWGQHFLVMAPPDADGDNGFYFYIIGGHDSTQVSISGDSNLVVSNQYVLDRHLDAGYFRYITSSKPVQVVLYTKSHKGDIQNGLRTDPLMMVVPPIEQYSDRFAFATSTVQDGNFRNHLMIFINSTNTDTLMLNDNKLVASWTEFTNRTRFPDAWNTIDTTYPPYAFTVIDAPHGAHDLWSTDPTVQFMAWLTGSHTATTVSYGYPVGMHLADIYPESCTVTNGQPGDLVDNDCNNMVDEGGAADPAPLARANGAWADWNTWFECSVTCGDGTKTRTRVCVGQANGGLSCPGSPDETEACNPRRCPECGPLLSGASCTKPNTVCSGDYCVCKVGYLLSGDQCVKRKLDQACSQEDDCTAVMDNSACTNGKCTCTDSYKANSDNSQCVELIIGDVCSADETCTNIIDNSKCHEDAGGKICVCNSGYIADDGNSKCRLRIITDLCSEDSDCTDAVGSSGCEDGRCKCKTGYIAAVDKKSCNPRRLYNNCTTTEDCSTPMPNSICTEATKVCACKEAFLALPDNAGCRPRGVGDICTTDSSCTNSVANSLCKGSGDDGMCTCMSGYQVSDNKLECNKRKVEDKCETSLDCTAAVRNSDCVSGTCDCLVGYVPSTDKTVCTKLEDTTSSSMPPTTTISVSMSSSKSSTMTVAMSSTSTSTKLPPQQTTSSSSSTSQTTTGMSSSTGPSSATTTANRVTSSEKPPKVGSKIFESCDESKDCQVQFSDCVGKKCTCNDGYIAHNENTICKKRVIEESCKTDKECAGVNKAKCDLNLKKCVCESGYYKDLEGVSCAARQLGDKTCNLDYDCSAIIPNSKCSSRECVCKFGYRRSSDKKRCRNDLENWEIAIIAAVLAFAVFAVCCVLLGWCGRKRKKSRASFKHRGWNGSSTDDLHLSSIEAESMSSSRKPDIENDLKSWPSDDNAAMGVNPVYETTEIKPSDTGMHY